MLAWVISIVLAPQTSLTEVAPVISTSLDDKPYFPAGVAMEILPRVAVKGKWGQVFRYHMIMKDLTPFFLLFFLLVVQLTGYSVGLRYYFKFSIFINSNLMFVYGRIFITFRKIPSLNII